MLQTNGHIAVGGRQVEYLWHPSADGKGRPVLVFLHEGLGSAGLWRDFPAALAAETGLGAFVYSRFGYGGSSPSDLPRPLSYMHDEAVHVLPALLAACRFRDVVLVGHSDGGSIALIHAGGTRATAVRGLILEAPHVHWDPDGHASINQMRARYAEGDLRERLARHHGDNVDVAFRGWADAWTDPGFERWNLRCYLPAIRVPMLLIQGEADRYGSKAHVDAIADGAGGPAELMMLPGCGHSPHHERRDEVLAAMARFLRDRFP